MDVDTLVDLLQRQDDLDWQVVDEGVVCDDRDGGDYVLLREMPATFHQWLLEFRRTDKRRTRFIDALCWWGKSRHIVISMDRNGTGHCSVPRVGPEISSLAP